MKKTILIIGAGEGLSFATAEKFGMEGYSIGLINRNTLRAESIVKTLTDQNITVYSVSADAADDVALERAIQTLKRQLGRLDVLLYNAAAIKQKDILAVGQQEFMDDFKINVGAALKSVQLTLEDLKESNGSILLTGGGLATHPSPKNGTLAIGKAGIRNLAFQLYERLKHDNIYVGTLTITAKISPGVEKHSPIQLAQAYWEMCQDRIQTERVI